MAAHILAAWLFFIAFLLYWSGAFGPLLEQMAEGE